MDFLNTKPDSPTLIEVGQRRHYISGAFSTPCLIKEVNGDTVKIDINGALFNMPTFLIGEEIK